MDHGHNPYGVNIDTGGGDRFPQWSIQETRDLLVIRAELDPTFMETKRNKLLWEIISTRMHEMGYTRTPDQCKSKWKNLVTRYKACETMEAEGMRQQFPFYSEMQTISNARIQRMLRLEAESGGGASTVAAISKKKAVAALQLSSEEVDENDGTDASEGEKVVAKKKRKLKGGSNNPHGGGGASTAGSGGGSSSIVNGIREIMDEYVKQHMEMEMQWVRAYEEREENRRAREREWRQRMEAMENERMMMERRWREREEQRKIREEARSEKRDALITALLNKLKREGM